MQRAIPSRKKKDHFAQAKAIASSHAAHLLTDSETIFIDCGTTLTTLARQIPTDMHLTVVCYSLNVAEILRRKPNVRLILLGGVYVPSSESFASDESVETLRRMGINKAFMSAGGVDEARGVTCWNFHEVAIKQAAMASAVERHLVVDASKLGKVKAVRFSQISSSTRSSPRKGSADASTRKKPAKRYAGSLRLLNDQPTTAVVRARTTSLRRE